MNGLAMGIYDDLDNQVQPVLRIDPAANNLVVFGGHRSGKTTFIKTMLVRLHEKIDPNINRAVYILDFGGNLGQYRELNYIAACFDNSNEENVRRVFRTLENQLEKNQKLLSSRQFLDVFYSDEPVKPIHLMLIIDNVNSFLADERYETYHELLMKFCRDGRSKGLSIVFTATDLSGGMTRLLGNFTYRLALEGSNDKYIDIFGMRVNEPMRNPGRGMTIIDGKPREFQLFLPFRNEDRDLPMFKEYLQSIPVSTEKLTTFLGDLTAENFQEYLSNAFDEEFVPDYPVIGLDYYDHMPIVVNLDEVHSIAIYGKKKFGKSNLLRLLVQSIRKEHPEYRFVYFDDGRKQLTQLYEEEKEGNFYLTSIDQMCLFLDENGFIETSAQIISCWQVKKSN
ncbi:MAG: FtsK/SpoIIIE domain-containing protein [Oscillospiraceae bacterium]